LVGSLLFIIFHIKHLTLGDVHAPVGHLLRTLISLCCLLLSNF